MTSSHLGAIRAISLSLMAAVFVTASGAVRAADDPAASPSTPPVQLLSLDRKASARQDDVRVTVELDQNPLIAGQPTWVTTTVKNLGKDEVVWTHAALCPIAVRVEGVHRRAEWRVEEWQRSGYDSLRDYAQHDMGYPEIRLRFTPKTRIGEGQSGCTDAAAASRIAPGGVVQERSRWDGATGWKLIPPPNGPVRVTAVFDDFKRVDDKGGPRGRIEVGLDALVVGGRDDLLHPMEIIDAALADPGFAALMETVDFGRDQTIYHYRPDIALWELGVFDSDEELFKVGLVDPVTGEVQQLIERPWDDERDEWPY
ncbi:MAG: hypothetical protein R6W93_14255 [Candidatus Limnocylindrales bacterium]